MTRRERLLKQEAELEAALRVIRQALAEDAKRNQVPVGRSGVAITQKRAGDLVMTSRGFVQVAA